MFLNLHTKVAVICYAILSLPYVALALDSSTPYAQRHARGFRTFSARDDAAPPFNIVKGGTSQKYGTVVNSTTVRPNIPVEEREVFYFRNFTMVGKKSEGFDVKQWELDNNHPDRSHMTPAERLEAGDSNITEIFKTAVFAGAVAAIVCIALSGSCATYIGTNINKFITSAGAGAGEAAVALLNAYNGNKHKRDELHEEMGCYYENGYDGTCANENVSDGAYSQVLNNDGTSPPAATCYESSDSSDGTVFGYYAHCLGDNSNCDLSCGSSGPDEGDTPNDIADPPSRR